MVSGSVTYIVDAASVSKPTTPYTCNALPEDYRDMCPEISAYISDFLNDANVNVQNNRLIYLADVTPVEINTGHSCTHSLTAKRGQLQVVLKEEFKLKFELGADLAPVAVRARLPIDIRVWVDLRDDIGFRFFGPCIEYGHDNYTIRSRMLIDSMHSVFAKLSPTYEILPDGKLRIGMKLEIWGEGDVLDLELHYERYNTNFFHQLIVTAESFYSVIESVLTGVFMASLPNDTGFGEYIEPSDAIDVYFILRPLLDRLDLVEEYLDDHPDHPVANDKLDDMWFWWNEAIEGTLQMYTRSYTNQETGYMSFTFTR